MTLIEVLIGTLIFGIVAAAGFQYYSKMHMAAMAQDEISELQHQGRNSLRDMRKSLRLAGYNLVSHVPVRISGDTLAVFYSITQPVDTVMYYLDEYSTSEYNNVTGLPTGKKLFRLMKKTNSEAPTLYADFVNDFVVLRPNTQTLLLTLTVQSDRPDDKYTPNNGYRTYTQGERVTMRNAF